MAANIDVDKHSMRYPIIDVAPGIWVWQEDYAGWAPGNGWVNPLNSSCVEADGEIVIVDPIAPADDASKVWARLDAHPPTVIVVLKPDHVRDVDQFAKRYKARAYGLMCLIVTIFRKPSLKGLNRDQFYLED